MKEVQLERIQKFIEPYRVTRGQDFRMVDFHPGDTATFKSEDRREGRKMLARGV